LEPSTPQDAKELTTYAFELSEKMKLPVMVRTVTRLSHMRSDVSLGRINKPDRKAEFDWESFSYRVAGFAKLFYREKELNEKLNLVREEFESLSFNRLKLNGDERLGVVGAGFSFNYVLDAVRRLGVENNVAYLKLASSHPLPEKLVGRLLETVDELLMIEEVDSFVELHVKSLAKDFNPCLKLYGRMNGCFPKEGELNPTIVEDAIADLLGIDSRHEFRLDLEKKAREILFERMLTLCAGCPHRATLYALKEVVREVKGDLKSVVVNGDIGCYGLGHAPPISFEDTYFCMGASIGVSQGMSQVGVDSIAFIGDGTFFHAGIPALINAIYNRHNIKVVVADNQVIAMTGFQPYPQSGKTAMGKPTKRIMIEDIAKACGIDHVEVVDPYNLNEAKEAFARMLKTEGVAMVVARRICATEAVRSMRPNRPVPYIIDPDLCIGCRICMTTFGCPALTWNDDEKKAVIDKTLCMGCGVCGQVCPQEAIKRFEGL
ncbi:MAG: thiamine pyrophosphate-dependent enzyme, partial [Candidatus Bathyarchaeia archaeon]